MSDHDRGAYTPQHDAPLSFDARQSRGRRGFPTTLVISLLILVGLVVAIFMFYRSGVRGAGEAPTPVGSPVGEIKAPPPPAAQQPADAAQGLQIYKSEGAPDTAPSSTATFAPPPEQPQPRPAPTAPVAAQPIAPAAPAPAAPAPAAAAAPAPPPKAASVPAAPAPEPEPKAKAVAAAPAPAAAKPAPPAKAAPKDEVGALLEQRPAARKAEAAPAASNPAHGAAVVQFGAFSSAALASSEWAKLAKAYPSDMSGKGKLVETVARDGKTLFRGAVSGFGSRADAVAFCGRLKADGRACIVR